MLFLDGERIDLKKITVSGGYKGDDFVMKQLAKAYAEAQQIGFPLRFKCDKLRRGAFDGKTQIRIPFDAEMQTPAGSSELRFAQSAAPDKGGYGNIYRPRGENMRKAMYLDRGELDKILFLMVGCPFLRTGLIYIEDLEKKARMKAQKRTAGSTLNFYLYNEKSPLFADEEKLVEIALALGIADPDRLGVNELKNLIYDRIETAEKIHDGTFGYKWFDSAMEEFTPAMTALKDIQSAIDKKIIRFNEKTYRWVMLNEKGEDVRILCPVEPHKTSLRRETLAALCVRSPEIHDLLRSGVEGVVKEEHADVGIERDGEGDEVKRVDFAGLGWHELRDVAKKNKILIRGKTKQELIKELEHRRETLVA